MTTVLRFQKGSQKRPDIGQSYPPAVIGVRDPVINGARGLFYLGCLLVPLAAIRLPAGLALSDLVFLLSGLVTLLSAAPQNVRPSHWLVTASVLAFVASLILAVSSSTPLAELAVGLRMTFVWGVWPVIGARVLLYRHQVGRAAAFFVAGGCLSAIVAIAQLGGIDLRGIFHAAPPDDPGTYARLIGLNVHPNGQGGTLAITFTIAAAALIYHQKKSLASFALILTTFGIVLSGSITGTLIAGVGLLVLLVRRGQLRTVVLLAIFAGPVWLLTSKLQEAQTGFLTPFQRISSATGQTGISTLDLRLQTIDFAWQRIVAHPWRGVGLASTEGGTYDGVTQTHNMEVLAWFQGGPLMLLAVIAATLASLAFVWRRTGDPLREVLFAALVCGLAFAQTGPALFDRYVWMTVVFAFALRHVCSEPDVGQDKRGEDPPR